MSRWDHRRRVSPRTRKRAKELRRDSTGPEQLLWSKLCCRQLGGRKFRRQFPIEPYIIDFYCPAARLAVELDGESHDGRAVHDNRRTEFLNQQGIRVVRISNDDVLTNLDGVLVFIAREIGLENQ